MRIMAVDYGDARTGVAVSDLLNTIAGDTFVIPGRRAEAVAEALAGEAARRDVGTIVLGFPRNMDGSVGPRAEKALAFADLLREATGLPVIMWDERRTTVDAHRILSENGRRTIRHRKNVDAVAASLILEGYLGSL